MFLQEDEEEEEENDEEHKSQGKQGQEHDVSMQEDVKEDQPLIGKHEEKKQEVIDEDDKQMK